MGYANFELPYLNNDPHEYKRNWILRIRYGPFGKSNQDEGSKAKKERFLVRGQTMEFVSVSTIIDPSILIK